VTTIQTDQNPSLLPSLTPPTLRLLVGSPPPRPPTSSIYLKEQTGQTRSFQAWAPMYPHHRRRERRLGCTKASKAPASRPRLQCNMTAIILVVKHHITRIGCSCGALRTYKGYVTRKLVLLLLSCCIHVYRPRQPRNPYGNHNKVMV